MNSVLAKLLSCNIQSAETNLAVQI